MKEFQILIRFKYWWMQDREHGDIWGCNAMQCNSGAAMQCNATLGLQCNAMQHLVSCNAMQLWGCNAMQCNVMQCNSGDALQCNIWYHSKEGRDSSAGKTQIWYRPRGDMETPSVASQCNAMWCNIWRVNGPTWYINSILHLARQKIFRVAKI